MEQSILISTKKILGLPAEYTAFDLDVITHINSTFAILQQLGVGPDAGFMIEDDTATWDTYLGGDMRLNNVRTYVFLKTRLIFDPPQTAHAIRAVEEQIKELEFRINVQRESVIWTDPNPPVLLTEDIFAD